MSNRRTELSNEDFKKLKYALYIRKSSEDNNSQVRSTDDQEKECRKLAKQHGLNIVDVFKDETSARIANNRASFDDLLQKVETGKYDGIIAWHPDRLSRNMLESGKIIDMLDNYIIKDLRFVTHQFTNNANGKMMLGMMFVFSKNYTDGMSENIMRGIDGNLEDGKSGGQYKWGYIRDDVTGYYVTDQFFPIIKNGWIMRADGATYDEILEYWKAHNVHRMTKINRRNKVSRRINPNRNAVANVMRDSFYYGKLTQVDDVIDLSLHYDFKTMVDEELYNRVQSLAYTRKRDTHDKKRFIFKPLEGIVLCGVCNGPKPMKADRTRRGSKGDAHVLSYTCKNQGCTRKVKSVRAHFIFDGLYRILEDFNLNDEAYERYSKRFKTHTSKAIVSIKEDITSISGAIKYKNGEIKRLSSGLANIPATSPAFEINSSQIAELDGEIKKLTKKRKDLSDKIADPNKIQLTKDEMLNLLKTAADKMRAGNPVEKDQLVRILMLNLVIDDKRAVSYLWKPPFDELVKAVKFTSGARKRT